GVHQQGADTHADQSTVRPEYGAAAEARLAEASIKRPAWVVLRVSGEIRHVPSREEGEGARGVRRVGLVQVGHVSERHAALELEALLDHWPSYWLIQGRGLKLFGRLKNGDVPFLRRSHDLGLE